MEDSDKEPRGAAGEDNPITHLLEIGTLALMEKEGSFQPSAEEFIASIVIEWVISRKTSGPPSDKHLAVAVADKLDASRIEYPLSATRWPIASRRTNVKPPARLATRRTESTRSPLVGTGPRRFIECASYAECLVRSRGLYTLNCL